MVETQVMENDGFCWTGETFEKISEPIHPERNGYFDFVYFVNIATKMQ